MGSVVQRDYNGATAQPTDSAEVHAILYKDDVYALDTVKTGASSTTALQFLDETSIDVGPGAELRLDSFVYDTASTKGAGHISFAIGAFRYVGGNMASEKDIRLVTPTATMVIRGTELVIYVWPNGSTEVNVVSGAVEVTGCKGGSGQLAMTGMKVVVTQLCTAQVAPARALPAGMAALSLPEYDEGVEDSDGGKDDRDSNGHSQPNSGGGKNRGTGGNGSSGGNASSGHFIN